MGFNARVTLPFVVPDTLKLGAYRMRQTMAITVNGFAEAAEVAGALQVVK